MSRRRNVSQTDLTVFACVTLLVEAFKDKIEDNLRGLLDAMFATGLRCACVFLCIINNDSWLQPTPDVCFAGDHMRDA